MSSSRDHAHTASDGQGNPTLADIHAASLSLKHRLMLFANELMECWQSGFGVDGADLQDVAEKFGLIVKTKYDPKKHGPNGVDAVAGDDWFEFSKDYLRLRKASLGARGNNVNAYFEARSNSAINGLCDGAERVHIGQLRDEQND